MGGWSAGLTESARVSPPQAQFIAMRAPAADVTRLEEIIDEIACNAALMEAEAPEVLTQLLTAPEGGGEAEGEAEGGEAAGADAAQGAEEEEAAATPDYSKWLVTMCYPPAPAAGGGGGGGKSKGGDRSKPGEAFLASAMLLIGAVYTAAEGCAAEDVLVEQQVKKFLYEPSRELVDDDSSDVGDESDAEEEKGGGGGGGDGESSSSKSSKDGSGGGEDGGAGAELEAASDDPFREYRAAFKVCVRMGVWRDARTRASALRCTSPPRRRSTRTATAPSPRPSSAPCCGGWGRPSLRRTSRRRSRSSATATRSTSTSCAS